MNCLRLIKGRSAGFWGLAVWALFCAGWVALAKKPWNTNAFDGVLSVKRIPLRDYTMAGLWIGLLVSGGLALGLIGLQRWWGRVEAAPAFPPRPPAERMLRRWFFPALAGILAFALWERWPGLTLGFWGDEDWMFCDFVHGKWMAATKGASLQGNLRFAEVNWEQAIFGDFSGNNHWLATVLQRFALKTWQMAGHHPGWAFQEWVIRLVPLTAGLASLGAMAGWLRWLGRPVAGLVAAGFMAVHPWHVRFSLEVRGYSLMLLFFILTFWAIGRAMQRGRGRDWLVVGLLQFLMMYSWKGGLYGLLFMNLVIGCRLLWGPMPDASLRRVALARWLAAGLFGAMIFAPLAMSSQLQMRKSIVEIRHRAKPMETNWRNNLMAETTTGITWHDEDPANPRAVSLERLSSQSKWTVPALGALGFLYLLGAWRLWQQDRFLGGLGVAVLASGVVAALHFKYGLRVELLSWYLLYSLPVFACWFAVAVTPAPGRRPAWKEGREALLRCLAWGLAGAAALSGFSALASPMVDDVRLHSREELKRAWQITRGRHEPDGFKNPSKILTGWLWRHTMAYDPRADMYVRTQEALDAKRALARQDGAEFYMIVGIRDLSEVLCGEVMRALRDPAQFDHLGTLWGVEALNTLDVYRMRKDAPVPVPGPGLKAAPAPP